MPYTEIRGCSQSNDLHPDGPGSALHRQGDHRNMLSGLPLPTHLSAAGMLISESERAQLLCGRKESK